MFWGLVLEPSKKYTQKVDQTFHISQASLDLKSCDQEPIQLLVEYENSNFVLATLCKKANIFQVPLDLIFKCGDQVSFRTIGNGKVHLSGYHILEDLDSMIMNGEEESDIDEMEIFKQTKGKRKKQSLKLKGNKKAKLSDGNEKESDDDDDDEDEDEDDEDEDEDDEEDDDDDDEEEIDDEDDEENISLSKKGKKKKGKAGSSILSMDDDEDDEDDEDDDDDDGDEEEDEDDFEFEEDDEDLDDIDDSESEKVKTPKQQNKKNTVNTPNGVASASKGKDKSAQKQNKNKKDTKVQGTPGKEGKTPKSEVKASKNEKHGKTSDGESSPQKKGSDNIKNVEKTPKTPKQNGSPQKKVLEGGVICEEILVGDGPVAKPGRMVQVYYVGTLATTKKQFDSVQGGPGFKFRLGRNEVIKGWDIGVNGMKVGGKRKLTIPPHLGYGSKGSPPVIPPNSTLVFTVELKGLS